MTNKMTMMSRGEYRQYKDYRRLLKLSKQAIGKYSSEKWSNSDDFENLTIRHAKLLLLEMLASELLSMYKISKYKQYKKMTTEELIKEVETIIRVNHGLFKLKE